MKNRNSELMEMLEYLELFALEERFKAICDSPKFSSLDSVQLLLELVSAEYDYRKEDRLDRLLRLSRLGKNTALASNLKSGNGRIYNENVIRQILTLGFVEKRLNLCIFGQSRIIRSGRPARRSPSRIAATRRWGRLSTKGSSIPVVLWRMVTQRAHQYSKSQRHRASIHASALPLVVAVSISQGTYAWRARLSMAPAGATTRLRCPLLPRPDRGSKSSACRRN